MEVYRISSRLFLLLGILCLATTLQGVQGGAESEGPSESECRPYIEKALKELETAEAAEPISPGDTDGESKEDVSTVEITTDDSDHVEGDGDNDDEAEESKDSTESAEIDQAEAISSKEEADDDRSEEQRDEESSSEDEKVTSKEEEEEEEETPQYVAEEEQSKEVEETIDQEESSEVVQSAEDEEATSTEEFEDVKDGSDETDDKKESAEVDKSIEDKADESDDKESSEDHKSTEIDEESGEKGEDEGRPEEDKTESAEAEQESVEEQSYSVEAEQQSAEKTTEESTPEEPDAEDEEASSEEKPSEEDQDSADDKSAEDAGTEDVSVEEGESVEDAEPDIVDEGHATQIEGDDSKEAEPDVEPTSAEESAKEEDSISKEDDGDGDHSTVTEQDSDSKVQEDSKATEETPVESEDVSESEEKESEEVDEPQADEPQANEPQAEESQAEEAEIQENVDAEENAGSDKEALEETAGEEIEGDNEEKLSAPEEELINEGGIPENLRSTDHIWQLLKLDDENLSTEKIMNGIAEITLRDLKRLYENAIKPLETLYKYRDLSNRHFGDAEIFSRPLILFMGPWSGGKSSIINYLINNEYNETSLRTGAEPSPAYFNILMYGEEPEVLDGTQLAADFTFSGLQKFGQGLEERLRGLKLPHKLLQKINIVEIPGILEVRKQISRVFPFNDACQWFIDRADIIYLVYDPSKLDVGPETEAILDQLKGREHQTRIILNKADQVKPEEVMRVQGALIWNISPLMSSAQPPVIYTTSLWSKPYEPWAPVRLLQAQERAFLRDLRGAIDKRIENKIASARRFAVRVRNHAKMVDCYLTTYYNHKSVFGNKKQVADAIIEHPQDYHIYEGLSTLTNISRYDLPDPDVYRDFFRLNPLYDFQQLSATCTYFRGCPINRLDVAIAYDLPELVGKHKRMVEAALVEANLSQTPGS